MCNYCNGTITRMFSVEVSDNSNIMAADNLLYKDALWYEETVFFEVRNGVGYIRLCDLDDCACLDHGKKVTINYCPMCGRKLGE